MTKLQWDQVGSRLYETGASQAALFVKNEQGAMAPGVAWNGLVAVRQTPTGAEPNDIFADNTKYLSLTSMEEFEGAIEAYTYPDEFNACDGILEVVPGASFGQQRRSEFGLVYRTEIGNDTLETDYGYKLHLIWNAKVSPSERAYETINDTPAAITFTWDFQTTPERVVVADRKVRPTSYLCLDSTRLAPEVMSTIENMVYGSDATAATMPTPQEVVNILSTPTPPPAV